jgi:uncharacterized membrane protein required for colicin V production
MIKSAIIKWLIIVIVLNIAQRFLGMDAHLLAQGIMMFMLLMMLEKQE